MKITPFYKKTKNGLEIGFRSALVDEAVLMIDYLKRVCGETPYMLSEAEDVNYTEDGEREFLKNYEESDNSLMLNAYVNGELAGNASFCPVSGAKRLSHRATMGIALFSEYCNQGIGELLINVLIEKAAECGYEIMELDVFSNNERGIHLYKKLGFEERGRMINAVKYKDGSYTDIIYMQRNIKNI